MPISSDTKAGIVQADEHVVETANNTIYKFREDVTSFIVWHYMTCLKVFMSASFVEGHRFIVSCASGQGVEVEPFVCDQINRCHKDT